MRIRVFQMVLMLSLTFGSYFPMTASGAEDISPEKWKEFSQLFVCNCDCGPQIDPLDETQCPSAKVFRKEIEQMLREGKSKEEIRDYYVSQFGESILRAPLKSGFSLTAWIFPFVSLAAGGGGIWFLIQRRINRNRHKLQTGNEEMIVTSSIESELYQEMIESERKKYL